MTDTAIRYDSATIELTDAKEDESFLRVKVAFARTGVFPYVRSDGKILREAKLPEDLFSPQTIESAKGIAGTNDHPPVTDNEGLINTSNYQKYARGALGDTITNDESMLWAYATVWDAELKKEILEKKKIEISVGFRSKQVQEPGEFDGEPYDIKQTNIRFNHFAFVNDGRAGESVRVYLDSADLPRSLDIGFQKPIKEKIMKKNFIEKARAVLDSAKALLDGDDIPDDPAKKDEGTNEEPLDPAKDNQSATKTDETEPDPAKQDNPDVELLKTRIQLLEQFLKEHQELLQKATSEAIQDSLAIKRLKLLDAVRAINPEAKTDGISSRELKRLVVAKAFPESAVATQDSIDSKLLSGYFEAALETLRAQANVRGNSGHQTASQDTSDISALKKTRSTLYKEV